MENKKVLFVCTGNIFRSVTAEYCFKKYLQDENITGWEISSAGIIAESQLKYPYMIDKLQEMNIKGTENHKQRRLDENILEDSDFVIAMAKNHLEFIKEYFNFHNVYLFKELVGEGKGDVFDIGGVGGDTRSPTEIIDYTVDYIWSRTPKLFDSLSRI